MRVMDGYSVRLSGRDAGRRVASLDVAVVVDANAQARAGPPLEGFNPFQKSCFTDKPA